VEVVCGRKNVCQPAQGGGADEQVGPVSIRLGKRKCAVKTRKRRLKSEWSRVRDGTECCSVSSQVSGVSMRVH
jgi:hypothetical protein